MYCELFLLFLRVVACQTVRLFEDITANRSLPQSVKCALTNVVMHLVLYVDHFLAITMLKMEKS